MTGRRSKIQDGGSTARGGCRNRHKGTGQQSTGSGMAGRASGPPFCPVAVVLGSLGECRPASLVNYLPGGKVVQLLVSLKLNFVDSLQEI